MARQFLIWETDEDLLAREWVEEIARDILRDLGRGTLLLIRLALWAGFLAWFARMWFL